METKEIKITPPEGYEIAVLNSNLECIKFKPIENKRWRDDKNACIEGYYINDKSNIIGLAARYDNISVNYNVFATEKQAKSSLAMARISQIIANDERFGGVITDEEWNNTKILKYIIAKVKDRIFTYEHNNSIYCFLAFHTVEQRDLFLTENEDLVRDYLMI
jgi:hypothetical protein